MVNLNRFVRGTTICIVLVLASACASIPKANLAESEDVFPHPVPVVHKEAINALISTGFEIENKGENYSYIQGARPLKPGLFISSGGETVGVWINELTPNKTQVKVHTTKTFVGGAGQRSWGNEILYKITKYLSK